MKLEQQVTNLELSKKLKELGVKQESYFTWSRAMDRNAWRIENTQFFAVDRRRDISAFTASELGEILPPKTTSWKAQEYWFAQVFAWDKSKIHREEADTEANARAKMLIYLLGNNLLSGGTTLTKK